jgi:quercetin dioxygenase-like cupin family protein
LNPQYIYFADLAAEVEPPGDGILSRTLYNDDRVKAVIFGFGAGQELSEHTASSPAILQVVRGEAKLTLGSDEVEAKPGAWIYMPPHLKHAIYAKTTLIMLLLLIK